MSSSTKKQKNTFRKKILALRSELSKEEWQTKSEQILKNLVETDLFKNATTVHSYISMNDRREVCTDELFNIIFKNKKQAVVPITNFEDHTLKHSEITPQTNLKENKWGVREPESVQIVDASELNLIVVPMVAADKKGNRLGYGQGFYDRFLRNTAGKKAGLIFNTFLFDEIPVEEFDVKLDVIITENEVIYT